MLQSSPNWQLCLFGQDGQALDHEDTEENIDPNSTRANEEVNKVSDKQQKIQDFIDAQKSKNTVYKTKSDLKIFSRYLAKENEERKIEATPVEDLTLTLPSSS